MLYSPPMDKKNSKAGSLLNDSRHPKGSGRRAMSNAPTEGKCPTSNYKPKKGANDFPKSVKGV